MNKLQRLWNILHCDVLDLHDWRVPHKDSNIVWSGWHCFRCGSSCLPLEGIMVKQTIRKKDES